MIVVENGINYDRHFSGEDPIGWSLLPDFTVKFHFRRSEHKLRLIRAVRFAGQLGFQIEAETWKELKRQAGDIERVSQERIQYWVHSGSLEFDSQQVSMLLGGRAESSDQRVRLLAWRGLGFS